eukprot:TRINITY_DN18965_c0_g1_i3.p2 TRINITY_DN18965_c0_g1~~TRINITY_DN18965_c0_g1_i3.p2  ORF type:complete len:314 (+),score=10.75 TRINITY_DN18965_c0_g1_i3:115-1056(+)
MPSLVGSEMCIRDSPGVECEVQHDLLELTRVDTHRCSPRGRHHLEGDILADQPSEHRLEPANHLVRIEDLGPHHLASAEGEELASEARGALGSLPDFFHQTARVPGILDMGRFRCIAEDHGEHVVEVMGYPARQAAEGLQSLGFMQFLLELALSRDVSRHPEGAVGEGAPRALDRDHPRLEATRKALDRELIFDGPCLSLADDRLDRVGQSTGPRCQVRQQGADCRFVGPIWGHAAPEPGDCLAPSVYYDMGVGEALEQGLESCRACFVAPLGVALIAGMLQQQASAEDSDEDGRTGHQQLHGGAFLGNIEDG